MAETYQAVERERNQLRARRAALEAELAEAQRKFAEAQTVVAGLSDLLRKEGAELAAARKAIKECPAITGEYLMNWRIVHKDALDAALGKGEAG